MKNAFRRYGNRIYLAACGLFYKVSCMIRKTYRSLTASILVSLVSISAVDAQAAKPNIPNIVRYELGFAELRFPGVKDIPTPNLDSLAASGVRFTSGYVSGP